MTANRAAPNDQATHVALLVAHDLHYAQRQQEIKPFAQGTLGEIWEMADYAGNSRLMLQKTQQTESSVAIPYTTNAPPLPQYDDQRTFKIIVYRDGINQLVFCTTHDAPKNGGGPISSSPPSQHSQLSMPILILVRIGAELTETSPKSRSS
ncbi:MAG: hypothetical protein M3036_03005 [Bifidobacteriales bacterium]|nr:hypothetical protein [Bifidobacteriales bacterium]